MPLILGQALSFARIIAVAATLPFFSQATAAHDFWIEPTSFVSRPGESVGVKLRVGEHLAGDPLPLMPSRVNQFVVDEEGQRKPVEGRLGADPAGMVRVSKPGLLVVGYFSRPNSVELAADKFNSYLAEEGLEAIAAIRVRRHQADAPGREIFLRCAKSLLLSGESSGSTGDHLLGFPLELVAERNPYAPVGGHEYTFRLTYQNQALAGAQVAALSARNPAERQLARTDSNGRVRLRLGAGGMWLIKAVHMVEAPAGSGADWASYWASLTFELSAAGAGAKQIATR